jgi:two-component system chemotaxis response regulator CheB
VPHRDLVVAGASAGGVEALSAFAAGLPADLPAAVMVVLHLSPTEPTALAEILDRAGPLPAAPARDGEPLTPGRIHVAVPDRHLLVKHDHVRLSRAPRQNGMRPSVDALFRSAARWRGPRTVGVVFSGALDDGAAGLAAIAASGGSAVVQDPATALLRGMPRAALAVVPGACVVPPALCAREVVELVRTPVVLGGAAPDRDLIWETEMAESDRPHTGRETPGRPAPMSCPDCSGGMNVAETGGAPHYICHVGHIWSPQSLLSAQREKIEESLWTAVSILEEQAAVHRALADKATGADAALAAKHQRAAAEEVQRAADTIRKSFPDLLPAAAG